MVTSEKLQGHWDQVKGRIRERWGDINDDELQQIKGDSERLVGVLKEKTGETRQEIEAFIEDAVQNAESYLGQAAETGRQYADSAAKAVQEGYQQVEQQVEAGYHEAEKFLKKRPVESVAAAFGAGMITGVVLTLLLHSGHSSRW